MRSPTSRVPTARQLLPPPTRGTTAVMAMLFLVVMTVVAVGMYAATTMNVQTSANLSHVRAARAMAESGLRWQAYRFTRMTRPRTLAGHIDAGVAVGLWPAIRDAVRNDYDSMIAAAERKAGGGGRDARDVSNPIALDGTGDRFVITIEHPFVDPGDPEGEPKMRVTSTASCGQASRSVSMDFTVDKKFKLRGRRQGARSSSAATRSSRARSAWRRRTSTRRS